MKWWRASRRFQCVSIFLPDGRLLRHGTPRWLEDRPRFQVHYTPEHASWLNQIELVFSILTRRLLRRGKFASPEELVDRIMLWIADYDRTSRPLAWTYEGKPPKVARPCPDNIFLCLVTILCYFCAEELGLYVRGTGQVIPRSVLC